LLGRLIAWVRRTLTSHLREPYVDPMFERQAAFNRHLALTLRELAGQVSAATEAVQAIRQTLGVEEPWEDGAAEPARSDLSAPEWARALPSSGANGAPDARGHKRQAWEERLGRIETLLAMVSTQVALLGASRQSSAGSPEIGELQRQLEALQRKLGANDA
ncbi:MAG TPA: hypothetical protein VER55_09720, partial [Ardenticatenaceae bacterium]|nr:hypothetical protein [Ardenticatenaceae bacterium]